MEDTKENVQESKDFAKELAELINRHGIDAKLNLQDYMVASYLIQTINVLGEVNKNMAYFQSILGNNPLLKRDSK